MPSFPALREPLSDGVVALREWRDADRDAMVEIGNDEAIRRWTRVPSPYTQRDAEEWFALTRTTRAAGHQAAFALVDADDDSLLGSIDLRLNPADPTIGELGYMVGPRARRRRVATRGVGLLTGWAFDELGLERMEILIDPRNQPSLKVAEAAGYVHEGVLRGYRASRNGGRLNLSMYALLRADRDSEQRAGRSGA